MSVRAYATGRWRNKDTSGAQRHAVDDLARLGGAMDTECGRTAAIPLGPWQPGEPRNCPGCAAALGETPAEETAA